MLVLQYRYLILFTVTNMYAITGLFYSQQVCISFLLHQGMVTIPKSVNPKRISENLKATQIHLDPEDIERIKTIDKAARMFRVYHSVVDRIYKINDTVSYWMELAQCTYITCMNRWE